VALCRMHTFWCLGGFSQNVLPANIMCDCNPATKMMKDPINDPCIPMEYKEAYEQFSFHALCQNAIIFLQVVTKIRWKSFNLKEILGDHMLESQDCDDILSLPTNEYCNHSMSMRKRMAAQTKLPTIHNSEYPRMQIVMNQKRKEKSTVVTMTFLKNGSINYFFWW